MTFTVRLLRPSPITSRQGYAVQLRILCVLTESFRLLPAVLRSSCKLKICEDVKSNRLEMSSIGDSHSMARIRKSISYNRPSIVADNTGGNIAG